jgi:hypothetical protein
MSVLVAGRREAMHVRAVIRLPVYQIAADEAT